MVQISERQEDLDKLEKARNILKEIFGTDTGIIWNTHFKKDIRPYLVGGQPVFIFDNTFGVKK